ncbi:uncharacterized protein PgNI_04493 [Pyricularia grisea]|uniref:Uncharacterized protein n=1 Tax=Pyricularia grisea TaxID=148305 RepID=A0A6P8BDL2_PYRGI|nr:uncharacterized protein PgNI_04493 [Pyricularia grisea]TLD13903.1 hypothetical protein PgNI_04493 [Pyricularia grisea]
MRFFKISYIVIVGAFSVSVLTTPVPGRSGGGVFNHRVGMSYSSTNVPSAYAPDIYWRQSSSDGNDEADISCWTGLLYQIRRKVLEPCLPRAYNREDPKDEKYLRWKEQKDHEDELKREEKYDRRVIKSLMGRPMYYDED